MYRPGGVQAVIHALSDGLRELGHETRIIAPQPKEVTYDDQNMILLGQSTTFNTPFATMGDLAVSIDAGTIDDMFAREQFDVVHFHEPWVPILARQLLMRSPAVNVATFHAKLPDGPLSKSLEKVSTPFTKAIFKQLTTISAVSTAAADFVQTQTDMPIEIIPNGIDLASYDQRKITPIKKYAEGKIRTILYVGRLEKRKGVAYLLPAYQELLKTHKNVRLVIVGDGDKRKILEQYVEKHSLPRVEFLGFVSEEDKLRLLRSADLFVSPALFGESFGIVLLEAMAMGLPLVAGSNPGYTSVMQDRGSISLVDPRDTAEFARRMALLLLDDEVRDLWQSWALSEVKQYDYPNVVKMYESMYKKALKAKK
jgi:phosphatidylinositol alpha-mannosyltransferase